MLANDSRMATWKKWMPVKGKGEKEASISLNTTVCLNRQWFNTGSGDIWKT